MQRMGISDCQPAIAVLWGPVPKKRERNVLGFLLKSKLEAGGDRQWYSHDTLSAIYRSHGSSQSVRWKPKALNCLYWFSVRDRIEEEQQIAVFDLLLGQTYCLHLLSGVHITILTLWHSLESGNVVYIFRFCRCMALEKSSSVAMFLSKMGITAVSTSWSYYCKDCELIKMRRMIAGTQ